jgi:hypothetical protein
MASDLREKLEASSTPEYCGIDNCPHCRLMRKHTFEGARLALESLLCPFADNCEGLADDNKCTRCAALASLASEGKGG